MAKQKQSPVEQPEAEKQQLKTPEAQVGEAVLTDTAHTLKERPLLPGQVVVAPADKPEREFVTTAANWKNIYSKVEKEGQPSFILIAEKKR